MIGKTIFWRFGQIPRIANAKNMQKCALRTLFTAETLELKAFQTNRLDAMRNVEDVNGFKWELKCYMENFKELEPIKLKKAIEVLAPIVESPDDIDLIKKSLYELQPLDGANEKTKRSVGNLVMSAIYTSNMTHAAIELFNDAALNDFFAGFKSSLLFVDLLYKNEMYDRIIVIDSIKRDSLWSRNSNFSKFIDVLVFGACYNINSTESLNYANSLWLKVGQRNQFIRCVAFYAALALNQGRMSDVLRILDGVKMNSVTEQIKIVALAELSYFNEVNESLASWAQGEDGNHSKRQISTDVIERLRIRFEEKATVEQQKCFRNIRHELHETDKTIKQMLTQPISPRIKIRGKSSAEAVANQSSAVD